MKIAIIGASYVGNLCRRVRENRPQSFITDKDGEKISLIAVSKIPFMKKGLKSLQKMVLRGMLNAIESTEKAVKTRMRFLYASERRQKIG